MARVFISYRRADAATFSGRIYGRLVARYGRKNVFKDVDDIPPGVDFIDYIQQSLRQCAVVLVVIGPRWLETHNAQGNRRLDDPADFVRLEIEAALNLGLTVIPLLVDGAHMPAAGDLPESLSRLVRVNALTVRNDPDFTHDMERVIGGIDQAFAARPAGGGLFGRRGAGAPHAPAPDVVKTPATGAAASDPAYTSPEIGPWPDAMSQTMTPAAQSGLPRLAAVARGPTTDPIATESTMRSSWEESATTAKPLPAVAASPRPRQRSGSVGVRRALLAGLAAVVVAGSFAALFYSGALSRIAGSGANSRARARRRMPGRRPMWQRPH